MTTDQLVILNRKRDLCNKLIPALLGITVILGITGIFIGEEALRVISIGIFSTLFLCALVVIARGFYAREIIYLEYGIIL